MCCHQACSHPGRVLPHTAACLLPPLQVICQLGKLLTTEALHAELRDLIRRWVVPLDADSPALQRQRTAETLHSNPARDSGTSTAHPPRYMLVHRSSGERPAGFNLMQLLRSHSALKAVGRSAEAVVTLAELWSAPAMLPWLMTTALPLSSRAGRVTAAKGRVLQGTASTTELLGHVGK